MEIKFILVNPKVPENIGASARALKTMGFGSLVLVNPCKDVEGKAKWLAHGSQDILDKAQVYSTLKKAIEDSDLVIGTTARGRWLKKEIIDAGDLKSFLSEERTNSKRLAIVFGSEESGLSNKEMLECDITTTISMADNYPSLNLSQAVMIYAYELAELVEDPALPLRGSIEQSGPSYRALKDKIETLLQLSGLSDNALLSGRILERITHAGEKDLNLIHSVTTSILELLKKKEK